MLNENKWIEPKWEPVPMPNGKTDEVYALVTSELSKEEAKVLGEYTAWYRERDEKYADRTR